MATVTEVQSAETRTTRRPYFSAIRWGAIIAGVVSGSASYLLLALLGVAVGLTAIEPTSAEPLGRVPLATGIWTGISMLVGAFIGGYVAGHMSGLQRSMDGMLHGFVSWGATTLLYAVLTTTAIGALLGGTFRIINQGMQTVGSAAQTATQGGGQGILDQMSAMIGGQVNAQSLQSLQQALRAGDRDAAANIMVNEMGMDPDRATQIADKLSALLSPQGQQNVGQTVKQTASQASDVLATTSWWLFIGLLLSLALGIAGGAAGVRASANRLAGDHMAERHAHLS